MPPRQKHHPPLKFPYGIPAKQAYMLRPADSAMPQTATHSQGLSCDIVRGALLSLLPMLTQGTGVHETPVPFSYEIPATHICVLHTADVAMPENATHLHFCGDFALPHFQLDCILPPFLRCPNYTKRHSNRETL